MVPDPTLPTDDPFADSITTAQSGTPVISAPSGITVKVGQLVAVSGVSVSDADAVSLGQTISVTLTATSGAFSFPLAPPGAVNNSASTHSATMSGSLAQVNSDLAGMGLFLNSSNLPNGTITISASDGSSTSVASFAFSSIAPHPITPATASAGINAREAALIDVTTYIANNPDVARSGLDAAVHFTQFGWREGRNPDPLFDVAFYLAHNPDVAAAGIDPLLHYATSGWKEGRDPSATFSTNRYIALNKDVQLAGLNPLEHFLNYGIAEGRGV
jgi:hypothetical protein